MIQKTLTFQGLSRLFFTESEFSLPDGWTKLTMDCSMVSPGTELFCIREGKTCMPGYIMTGHAFGIHNFRILIICHIKNRLNYQ